MAEETAAESQANRMQSLDREQQLRSTIRQNLQDIALQLEHPISESTAERLYQEAVELLNHIPYEPITLARVAGMLLIYQSQRAVEPEEVEWFKSQVRTSPTADEVEELLESMYRTDTL